MSNNNAVGLIITTEIENKKVAVLQRRGVFNTEKMAPESWPGACQPTVHGKLIHGETLKDSLWREMEEEIGEKASYNVISSFKKIPPRIVQEHMKGEKVVKTFTLHIPDNAFLKEIRLNADTGGLVYASEEDVKKGRIFDLEKITTRERGITDLRVIAMFSDEKSAIEKIFSS